MPADVELVAVQLPGREERIADAAIASLSELASLIAPCLESLCDLPFGIFGYSMGAQLGHALAQALRSEPQLRALFVAASPGPSTSATALAPSTGNAELVAYLRQLGGTPDEVLASEEMMAILLPTIRGDLTAVAGYRPPPQSPLNIPVFAFAGSEDPTASPEIMQGWAQDTRCTLSLTPFDGGHFFIQQHAQDVVTTVLRQLRSVTSDAIAAHL